MFCFDILCCFCHIALTDCSSVSTRLCTLHAIVAQVLCGHCLQSQNQLEGVIPQDNTLVSLIVLDLSRNQLEGTLPRLLQHNEKVQVALFSHNRFSGTIPAPVPVNQLGTKSMTSLCTTML